MALFVSFQSRLCVVKVSALVTREDGVDMVILDMFSKNLHRGESCGAATTRQYWIFFLVSCFVNQESILTLEHLKHLKEKLVFYMAMRRNIVQYVVHIRGISASVLSHPKLRQNLVQICLIECAFLDGFSNVPHK